MYKPLWVCITLSQEWFSRVIKQQFGQAESLTLSLYFSQLLHKGPGYFVFTGALNKNVKIAESKKEIQKRAET